MLCPKARLSGHYKKECVNYDNWFVAINDNHDKPFFIFMNIVISG